LPISLMKLRYLLTMGFDASVAVIYFDVFVITI